MAEFYKTIKNDDGDETFSDGLVAWNITKLLEYIEKSEIEFYNLPDYDKFIMEYQNVDEAKINLVDLDKPIIIALFNSGKRAVLIDGIHRIRKAKKHNDKHIKAYMLPFEEHSKFFMNRMYFERGQGYDSL